MGGGEGCDNVLDSRLLMNKWQTCSYACHGLGGSAGGGGGCENVLGSTLLAVHVHGVIK